MANYNASKAYELAGYKPHRENASQLLTKDHIAAAIAKRRVAREQALIMSGHEALTRISNHARADIRKLFPPEHQIAKLPDDVAMSIKVVTPGKYGDRIELYDALRAAELLAKAGGKLKDAVKVEHSLEEIIAASNRLPADTQGE